MAAAITFYDVHKRYRIYRERYRSLKEIAIRRRLGVWEDRWALRGVSLEIEPGSTFGLVGANGAGKSTALKVMARILTPDRGKVSVNGRLSALIELGAGFQLEYTGRENVYLNASLLGVSRKEIDRKFDDIVAFAELEDHINRPLRTYSSGMYMRLGFSVAIHVEPEILLVDEVLAVGDESFQRKCMDWLEGFQRKGGTIVFVTHSLGVVTQLCSKAAWIQGGQVVAMGTPRDVVSEYLREVREQRQDAHELRRASEFGPPPLEVTDVRLLDRLGRPATVIQRGNPLQVEISYRCNSPVPTPVFGVALYRDDGAYIYGTNTSNDGIELPPIERDGTITLRYHSLPLLGSTYLITVGVFGSSERDAAPIDYHEQRYSFLVLPPTEEQGTVAFDHDWSVEMSAEMVQPKERLG